MKAKLINDGPQKTYVVVLETGEEAVGSIESFAPEHRLGAAQFTGVGAFSDAVLGFFDWETKAYRRNSAAEQVEVVSLIGDVPWDRTACPRSTRMSSSAARTVQRWAGTCWRLTSGQRSRSC